MRLASDWLKSKTTWTAAGALCYALADVAAKGELTWQSALVALVGILGATIRDTVAKGHEETKLSAELFERAIENSAASSRATAGLAVAMTGMTEAILPKDVQPGMTPRRNVAGRTWPTDYPEVTFGSPAGQGSASSRPTTEPDGEADRDEETHL
jgi:hypothetical protein